MSMFADPVYRFCPRQKVNVNLDQSEGECRDFHGCGDEACPLAKEFLQPSFRTAFSLLIPSLRED